MNCILLLLRAFVVDILIVNFLSQSFLCKNRIKTISYRIMDKIYISTYTSVCVCIGIISAVKNVTFEDSFFWKEMLCWLSGSQCCKGF